ncbi:MAG: efflux RND transporter periplasmic adaptor subunit [Phycisphaeraceae bacterium]|nr:efflux RND transporter periplasmic adaptor subunit [Phycisphaeraceae bacterium]
MSKQWILGRMPLGAVACCTIACVVGHGAVVEGASRAQAGAWRQDGGVLRQLDPAIISQFSDIKAVTNPGIDAVMGFSLPTQISEVLVRGGQEVSKGDLLIRGDDAEDLALLRLQKVRTETDLPVQRARKQMELAETEFRIQQEVAAKGGSSPQQVERAKLASEVARIDYENARVQQTQEVIQQERIEARVDKFRLRAPFDGVVDQVMMDMGQVVAENEKIIRIVSVDTLWLDAPAPTSDPLTLTLKRGDPAWVLLDVAGTPRLVEGKVKEAAPTADPASRTRRIRVEIANPKGPDRLLSGEPCYVRFRPPSEEFLRLIAPKDAVETAASGG